MAEVVEDKSRTSPDFPRTETCGGCKSKIRVDLGDLKFERWKTGGYWFAGTETIEDVWCWYCPACNSGYNRLRNIFVPVLVRNEAVDEYRERKKKEMLI
jgi:hypothetical protein